MYLTAGIGSTQKAKHSPLIMICRTIPSMQKPVHRWGSALPLVSCCRFKPCGFYADTMERAFYNGTISGMQLDGKRFFYVNPLEVVSRCFRKTLWIRSCTAGTSGWYACACCPPNLARLLTSLGSYAWAENESTIFSHLFVGGKASFSLAGGVDVALKIQLSVDGNLTYTFEPKEEVPPLPLRCASQVGAKNIRCA